MSILRTILQVAIAVSATALTANLAFAHGDVTPQPIDASDLKPLSKEWLDENPYRGDPKAIAIGASGYNQNCARCHGLEAISGGIAPDLRYLETGKTGDEWFIERIRHGKKNAEGTTIMPAFEGVFTQEAMWAIRAFLESKHEE